jgi:hypothetical protein
MSPSRARTRKTKAAGPAGGPFAEQCAEAVTSLDRLLEASPYPPFQELDAVQRAIVRLRDGLIDRLRQDKASAETPGLRGLLDRVNTAISLIVGIEHPSAGIRRELLEMARDVLKGALTGSADLSHSTD